MEKLSKIMLILFVATVGLVSCSKEEVDDRDAFVGSYSVKVTGYITMAIDEFTYTVPFDETGSLDITKVGNDLSLVKVSGLYNANANISSSSILIDSESMTQTVTEEGETMIMTVITDHERGFLNGDVITFTTKISGNAVYSGISIPIFGTLSNVATKQ